MERENLKSRLGFILISAGCAIGVGNVWKFPYMVGNNGGGAFVLIYIIFLVLLGMPILTMEFAMGRASRKSIVCVYEELVPQKKAWRVHGYMGILGNYMLMFFYTSVAGWMLDYCFKYVTGGMENMTSSADVFGTMLASTPEMVLWMFIVIAAGIFICSMGLQNGVEKITKVMMTALLVLIVVLAIHSLTLSGAKEGLRFYLYPDLNKMKELGIGNVISAAMNQAFFTLSLGIGAMLIFGSYIGRDHALLGESINIVVLDTFVAIVSGLIIFPACFSYGVEPNSGPSLIFITLPNIFASMAGGRIWGALFFLFLTFAALSTIIAVFENIICCCMDKFHWSRKKAAIINFVVITVFSLPCALGYNVLSWIQPFGEGTTVLDFEDFVVSNLLLPLGSLIIVLFCMNRYGWGFENYLKETNTGKGLKMPSNVYLYCKFVIPVIVAILIYQSVLPYVKMLFA